MARVIVYYAHPGHRFSNANAAMWDEAGRVDGITKVDLYAEYPRFDINIDREQGRLVAHDVILVQCPLFWYSTPSLVKEWIDLTLEHGFAYGSGGDALVGKTFMFAFTAAGPDAAYTTDGYQHYPLRTFLTPLERTAGLCQMRFPAPYVLYGALQAVEDQRILPHAKGYRALLQALRDDRFDLDRALGMDVIEAGDVNTLMKDAAHG